MATPCHSIGFCPICGDGLCGIRIYQSDDNSTYGLVVCDECDAVWTEPNLSTKPFFPDTEDERSPIDGQPIWGATSHWADLRECALLGWLAAIDPILHCHGQQPSDDDPLDSPAMKDHSQQTMVDPHWMAPPSIDIDEKNS
jgi:hypothetical protein